MMRWTLACAALCVILAGANARAQDDAAALLQRASELENPCRAGAKPFELHASFTVEGLPGHGSYALVWKSPTEWRREVATTGPVIREVRNGGTLEIDYGGATYVTEAGRWLLDNVLPLCFVMPPRSPYKMKLSKSAGTTALETNTGDPALVFDDASGLLEVRDGTHYSDRQPFRQVQVAMAGRRQVAGEAAYAFQISSIKEIPAPQEAVFELPGSVHYDYAAGETPPELVSSVDAKFPVMQPMVNILVAIEFTVDRKGLPRDLHVSKSNGTKDWNGAAMAAVKQYVFNPALKGGVPIDKKLTVEVHFSS